MKLLISIAFILFGATLVGQQLGNNTLYSPNLDSTASYLNISTSGYYSSNIFDNAFVDKLAFGGFISDEEKNNAFARTKNVNHAGGELNLAVEYSTTKVYLVKDFGFYTHLSYNNSLGAQFTRDLYQLALFGNTSLAQQEAVLSPSAFYLRDANQFSFGLNKNNQLKVGLTLSSFNNNTGAKLNRGSFFTDTINNTLTLDIEGDYFAVDTNNSVNFFSNNAVGIGIDLETVLKLKEKGQNIHLGVRNVGVLVHKNAYQINARGDYTYKGTAVNSFKNIGENLLTQQAAQDSIGITTKTETRTSLLPFEIYFFQVPTYKKRMELIYGFRYKNESAYKAFLYLGGNLKINNAAHLSTFISHGGYTNFQWGVSAQAHLKKMYLGVNSNNILGFFSNKAFGQSLGLSLTYLL